MTKVKIKAKLKTSGRGLWTEQQRQVHITKLKLTRDEDFGGGELQVYFDRKDWNIRKHGFIYTDPMFLRELQSLLKRRGLTGISGVDYTEQGMQGTTYVSLYVGQRFVNSFDRKFSKM